MFMIGLWRSFDLLSLQQDYVDLVISKKILMCFLKRIIGCLKLMLKCFFRNDMSKDSLFLILNLFKFFKFIVLVGGNEDCCQFVYDMTDVIEPSN